VVIGRVGLISVEQAEQCKLQRQHSPTGDGHQPQNALKCCGKQPVDGKTPSRISQLDCLEVGKAVREADSEVSEAIDFCRYYASEMEQTRVYNYAGETNRYHYQPRGIVVVISPWNFPLAIATGMTVAAS